MIRLKRLMVELYLKPALNYVLPNQPVNFYTVVESAQRQGEIAIGYRLHGGERDADAAYGVVVNPDKSHSITFAPDDRLIVLAES